MLVGQLWVPLLVGSFLSLGQLCGGVNLVGHLCGWVNFVGGSSLCPLVGWVNFVFGSTLCVGQLCGSSLWVGQLCRWVNFVSPCWLGQFWVWVNFVGGSTWWVNFVGGSYQTQSLKDASRLALYCQDVSTCRHASLLEEFDQVGTTPCGMCDVCESGAPTQRFDASALAHRLRSLVTWLQEQEVILFFV